MDPRSEKPFNEERQFDEAKLPVFEMGREAATTGEACREKSFGEGSERQDARENRTRTLSAQRPSSVAGPAATTFTFARIKNAVPVNCSDLLGVSLNSQIL